MNGSNTYITSPALIFNQASCLGMIPWSKEIFKFPFQKGKKLNYYGFIDIYIKRKTYLIIVLTWEAATAENTEHFVPFGSVLSIWWRVSCFWQCICSSHSMWRQCHGTREKYFSSWFCLWNFCTGRVHETQVCAQVSCRKALLVEWTPWLKYIKITEYRTGCKRTCCLKPKCIPLIYKLCYNINQFHNV